MNTVPTRALRQQIERLPHACPHVSDFDEQEVLAALREDGITTLEQLVSRTLQKMRDGRSTPTPLIGPEDGDTSVPIVHGIPQMPVTIDGVEYDPNDVRRFDGTPLHFLFYRLRDGEPILQALTDQSPLVSARLIGLYSRPTDWPPTPTPGSGMPGQAPPGVVGPGGYDWVNGGKNEGTTDGATSSSGRIIESPPAPPGDYDSIQMFSDVNYEGDWCWLGRGRQYARLSDVSRNKVLFFSGDWNDQISSLGWTGGSVTYYEHAGFKGSTLDLHGSPVPSLTEIGWNDRISSVRYWP